ncbi:MAG TPA: hypothetical protein DHW82_06920 [Spirochaetia bacterium]|nr:hypothetical protein [Spirochaetia bacterium]
MKKHIHIIFFFLFIGSFSQILSAKTISMEDYLKGYLEKSWKLKEDSLNLEKSKAGIEQAEAIDDYTLKSDGGYAYQKGGYQSSYELDHANVLSLGISIDKMFSDTGTIMSLSHDLNDTLSSVKVMGSTSQSDLSKSSLSLSLIQPILKNWMGIQSKLPKKIAAIDLKIKEITYLESIEGRMVEAATMYLDWLYLHRQKTILKDIIAKNTNLLKETTSRFNAGIAEVSDLESAKQNVMLFENTLREVDNAYQGLILNIKRYIEVNEEDIPDDKVFDAVVKISAEHKSQRVLEILQLTKKQLGLSLETKENNLLPDLSLLLSYTLAGYDYQSGSNSASFGKSYSDLMKFGKHEIFLGFQFSLPLGNDKAKGELKALKIDFQKMENTLKDTEESLLLKEKTISDGINIYFKLIKGQEDYVASLEKKEADQKKQYKQGQLGLTEIIRTSIDLSNAKLTLTKYIVQHYKYYYQLLELQDQMMEQYQNLIPKN